MGRHGTNIITVIKAGTHTGVTGNTANFTRPFGIGDGASVVAIGDGDFFVRITQDTACSNAAGGGDGAGIEATGDLGGAADIDAA